jgi:hypothetical protein
LKRNKDFQSLPQLHRDTGKARAFSFQSKLAAERSFQSTSAAKQLLLGQFKSDAVPQPVNNCSARFLLCPSHQFCKSLGFKKWIYGNLGLLNFEFVVFKIFLLEIFVSLKF